MRHILAVYIKRATTETSPEDFFAAVAAYAEALTAKVDWAIWDDLTKLEVGKLKEFGLAGQLYIPPELVVTEDKELTAAWICEVAKQTNAPIIIMPHSQSHVVIAARAALKLKAALVTDCVSINIEQGQLTGLIRPLYGSKIMATYTTTNPLVVTIRDRQWEKRSECNKALTVIKVSLPSLRDRIKLIERKILKEGVDEVSLVGAKLVIGAGRGVGGPAGLEFVKGQAQKLGAALAVSKAVVDAGWAPITSLVGISGKKINPHLYIAVGISGSIQHMTGASGARAVIAINTDPEAPIMENTDLGLVGDYKEILPALVAMMKKK